MAINRDSDYNHEPSGFEHMSPRGSKERQDLDFLDDFESFAKRDQMEKHIHEKMLYRRGITYTVILSLASFYIFRYLQNKLVATSILFLFAFSIEDVRSALYSVWSTASTPTPTALERRSSSVPTDYAPGSHISIPRRYRNIATRATMTGHDDPYLGLHPDNQPRRLWRESLNDAWPHVARDSITILQRIPYIVRDMFLFHCVFQILITLMQTLGVHFREGHDDVGLFPRAFDNIISTQNLFGVGGLAGVGKGYASITRWLWNWIVVAASKFWGFLAGAEIVPGSDWTDEQLKAAGISNLH